MAKARRNQSREIELQLIGATEKVVGQVQVRVHQALSSATPVDTGFARAGWTPSVTSAAFGPENQQPDKTATRRDARTRHAANVARVRALAAAYKLALGKAFIANSTSYLPHLNAGSSAQAGPKWIERAIEAVVRSFHGKRL